MKLTHASLFSGFGGPDLAAEWLGWENLFHCEINEFCNTILEYHFPKSKTYRDVTTTDFSEWRGRVDVLTGGFPCFVKGTKILTDKGFRSIETLSIGDNVLTKERRFMPVNAVMNKPSAPIVSIKYQGHWDYLNTTAEHPFWTKKRSKPHARKYENKFDSPDWIEAKNISKGDFIAMPCIEGKVEYKTEEFWYLIGRYLGDGWFLDGKRTSKMPKGRRGSRVHSKVHKVVICSDKSESDFVLDAIEKAGYTPTVVIERTVVKFIINSKELCEFVKQFGRYSSGKTISGMPFQLKNNLKKSLFAGWAEADGYVESNGTIKVTTVSSDLAVGMSQIARDCFMRPVSISKKHVNRVCVIDGRTVNERDQYCVSVSANERYGYYKDGYVWQLVKDKKNGNEQKVYNIGVECDESYTANGAVVHNCQPFSIAGARKGADDNRYLWPHFLRAIGEIKPTWVIGENVGGILTMVQPGAEIEVGSQASLFAADNKETVLTEEYVTETICKDLEREGYSVQPVIIPACAIGAPHRRDRVFFIAHCSNAGIEEMQREREYGVLPDRLTTNPNSDDARRPRHGEIGCSEGEGEEVQREWKWIRCDTKRVGSKATFANTLIERCNDGCCDWEKRQIYYDIKRYSKKDKPKRGEWKCRTCKNGTITPYSKGAGVERKCERKQKQRKLNGRDSCKIPTNFKNFPTQSPICSGDDGISDRLECITFPKWRAESVKGYGNAIVPNVMYEIFKIIDRIKE